MQGEEQEYKGRKGPLFYTYHGKPGGEAVPAAPAEAPTRQDGVPQDASIRPKLPDVYEKEFPEPDERQKRRKTIKGALGTLAIAAGICALAFAGYRLGLFGGMNLSIAGPQASAPRYDANSLSMASVYLNSQQWDKKSHDTLKSLGKIKNLRVVLEFLDRYPPSEIAAMPRKQSGIDDAISNYGQLAGTILSIQAVVTQKYAVTENLMPESGAPSTLLSLQTDQENTGASMLVIGSSLDGVKEGDSLTFACLPIYLYVPKDQSKSGGIFFVTLPELVQIGDQGKS